MNSNQETINELQSNIEKLNFLHDISQKISEIKELHVLLNQIIKTSKSVMNAEASSILLYNENDKKLYFDYTRGKGRDTIRKLTVNLGEGIAGWVAQHKKSLLIEDCYNDKRFAPKFDSKTRFKTKSMICVPLLRNKRLLGVMQVINKKDQDSFSNSDQKIFETLASQCAVALENSDLIKQLVETKAIERELQTARDIQKKLLPSTLPFYDDIDIAADLIPAKEVGGDYYDVHRITENQSLFILADVAGKSISAALLVSTIDSCLHTFIKMESGSFNLQQFVTTLNRVLIESTTPDKFATMWIGLYDHDTKKLSSVSAGHNPQYLFRKNLTDPFELTKGGVFVGMMDLPYEVDERFLESGDILVLFTDGITEAWNKDEEEFGEERLIKSVKFSYKNSASEILNMILKNLNRHVGSAEQSDDLTCLVLKLK